MKNIDIEVFAIDDDEGMRQIFKEIFDAYNLKHYQIFEHPEDLLKSLHPNVYICIVDYLLASNMNGLQLIKKIASVNKHCWFIMLSGQFDKSVILDFLNSVHGSRYIEKNGADPLNIVLVDHIRDINHHIEFLKIFYKAQQNIKEVFTELKNIVKND